MPGCPPQGSPVQWCCAEHRHFCKSTTVLIKGNIRALAQGLTAALMQIMPQSWLTRRLLWGNANVTFAAYLLWANTSKNRLQIIPGCGKDKGNSRVTSKIKEHDPQTFCNVTAYKCSHTLFQMSFQMSWRANTNLSLLPPYPGLHGPSAKLKPQLVPSA